MAHPLEIVNVRLGAGRIRPIEEALSICPLTWSRRWATAPIPPFLRPSRGSRTGPTLRSQRGSIRRTPTGSILGTPTGWIWGIPSGPYPVTRHGHQRRSSGETGAGPTRRPAPRGRPTRLARGAADPVALERVCDGELTARPITTAWRTSAPANVRPSNVRAGGKPSPRRRRIGRRLRLGSERSMVSKVSLIAPFVAGASRSAGRRPGYFTSTPSGLSRGAPPRLAGIRRARRWVKDPHLSTAPAVASSRAASWAIGRRLERAPDAKGGG